MTVRFTNLKQFEKELQRFTRKTGIAPDVVARKLQFEVFKGVVQRTPVDTGWARANWQLAKGPRPDGIVGSKPSAGTVLPEPAATNVSIGQAPVYWVVNNLPYIVPLENGHSKQMGKGYMVQRTLVAVQAEIRALLKELD